MITMKIDIEKILRVGTQTHDVLDRVKQLVTAWSDGEEEFVHFYEPSSPCFQLASPPFAYWRIDEAAFEAYGPLPFTAGGKPVRWTWLYWLQNAPTLTVTPSDLHS